MKISWKAITPLLAAAGVALLPAPAGLPLFAWRYFALFAGVVAGIILEPLPGGAVGLIGVTAAALLDRFVLFSPQELGKPGFDAAGSSINWALSGFGNGTVWLIFAAFMFSLGYKKTGLGARIALLLVRLMGRRTLLLGYSVMLADTALAPFTPSVTARSAGTIYPVLLHLPPLYDSRPNDPSMRRIGSYILWVAMATSCVSSSLFLTALAPNLLAMEIVRNTVHLHFTWMQWFLSALPMGLLLLVLIPLVGYVVCRPEVTRGEAVVAWAAEELRRMGSVTRGEKLLLALVALALVLWIAGGSLIDPTVAALAVIVLMLLLGVLTWDDVLKNSGAWNTLVWFATLVALAAGLGRVGFIGWFAQSVCQHVAGLAPLTALLLLLTVFYFSHYAFASITAHVTAMLPVLLAVALSLPGLPLAPTAMLLCLALGLMGVLTPYASGQNPVYYGSGYLPSQLFWRLGAIFGLLYFAVYVLVAVPWVLVVGTKTFLAGM
jgi:L-tartrate/succinate antiporter